MFGQYNSLSINGKSYFAHREYTSKRLDVSKESVTNWTKELDEKGFLSQYDHISGYYTKQKIVKTKDYEDSIDIDDL